MDKNQLYHTARTLGLSNTDIDTILSNQDPHHTPVLSLGPPYYQGGHYATISIKDIPD